MSWAHPGKRPRVWFRRSLGRKERAMYLLVGRRGQGKTLLATDIAIARMRRGERVYANFGITDWQKGLRAGRISNLYDLIDLSDCTVVIDEANLWASSRQWQKIPPEVLSRWSQSRHFGLSLVFTSQHEDRVDTIIRELVDWVIVCQRLPIVPRRFPVFRTHYTFLEEINQIRRGELSKASLRWVPSYVFAAYDTHEIVDASQLDKAAEIRRAIKAGEEYDSTESGLIHPERWRNGQWEPWEVSTSASA